MQKSHSCEQVSQNELSRMHCNPFAQEEALDGAWCLLPLKKSWLTVGAGGCFHLVPHAISDKSRCEFEQILTSICVMKSAHCVYSQCIGIFFRRWEHETESVFLWGSCGSAEGVFVAEFFGNGWWKNIWTHILSTYCCISVSVAIQRSSNRKTPMILNDTNCIVNHTIQLNLSLHIFGLYFLMFIRCDTEGYEQRILSALQYSHNSWQVKLPQLSYDIECKICLWAPYVMWKKSVHTLWHVDSPKCVITQKKSSQTWANLK